MRPLEEDFLDVGRADQLEQHLEVGVLHGQPEPLDRDAEAARFAADAQIAARRDFQPAADAIARDRRDHRMAALEDRLDRARPPARMLHGAFGAVPRLLELADVGADREGAIAVAAQDDAAHVVVGRQRVDRLAEAAPHRLGEGVELGRPVEQDGRDRSVPLDADRLFEIDGRAARYLGHGFCPRPLNLTCVNLAQKIAAGHALACRWPDFGVSCKPTARGNER